MNPLSQKSEPPGRGFYKNIRPNTIKDAVDDTIHCVFYFCKEERTRKIKSQYAGGILLQPVQKLVATLIFARPPQRQKCKRVSSETIYQVQANNSHPAYAALRAATIPQSRLRKEVAY